MMKGRTQQILMLAAIAVVIYLLVCHEQVL